MPPGLPSYLFKKQASNQIKNHSTATTTTNNHPPQTMQKPLIEVDKNTSFFPPSIPSTFHQIFIKNIYTSCC